MTYDIRTVIVIWSMLNPGPGVPAAIMGPQIEVEVLVYSVTSH